MAGTPVTFRTRTAPPGGGGGIRAGPRQTEGLAPPERRGGREELLRYRGVDHLHVVDRLSDRVVDADARERISIGRRKAAFALQPGDGFLYRFLERGIEVAVHAHEVV